jgi:dTDP-4-amino-4,6-dideoxygalactose transaminase
MNPIYGQDDVCLPNCEKLNQRALNLPLHPRMTDTDVAKIIGLVINYGEQNGL